MPASSTSLLARLSADSPAASMPDLCDRLGEFLGLDGAAPPEVVRRALDDPGFETDLIISRGAPGFLRALFDQQRTRAYLDTDASASPVTYGVPAPSTVPAVSTVPAPSTGPAVSTGPAASATSNTELMAKAAGAMVRWGKAGFGKVDLEVLQRREDACLACPHLTDPRAAVQKLAPAPEVSDLIGARTGKKVCELCGCQVSRKMRMTTESCPGSHQADAGLTRWGEPAHGGAAQTEGD
jgi:hypothetical protein